MGKAAEEGVSVSPTEEKSFILRKAFTLPSLAEGFFRHKNLTGGREIGKS